MLTIDQLSLRLPAGYQHRADGIVNLVAKRLADIAVDADLRVDRIHLSDVTVAPTATDADVATEIAHSIQRGLTINHSNVSNQGAP